MKKKHLLLFTPIFTLLLFMIVSCDNDQDSSLNVNFPASTPGMISDDINTILALGFDTTNISVYDSLYVVEGDIMLKKNKISEYLNSNNAEITTRQARVATIVSREKVSYIKFKIDASLYSLSNWREAILQAASIYNQIGSCIVRFVENPSDYDVLIKEDTSIDPALGKGSWPLNGNVGDLVKINTAYNYLSLSQKVFLIVHELGHNLGLRHTNWSRLNESIGIQVAGTPNSGYNPDPNSVMNGRTGGTYWTGFSYYDLVALRELYPIKLNLHVSSLTANVNGYVSYTIEGEIPIDASILWESNDMTLISGQNTKKAVFKTSGTKYKKVKATVSCNGSIISELDNSRLWVGVPYYVSSPNYEEIIYRSRVNLAETFHLTARFNGYPMVYKWTVNGSPLSAKYLDNDIESIAIFYKYLLPGDYTYTVTATNFCGESSITKFKIKVVNI